MSLAITNAASMSSSLGCFTPLSVLQTRFNGNGLLGGPYRSARGIDFRQGYVGLTKIGGPSLIQNIGNTLCAQNDPVGQLLRWQAQKGLRPEELSADDRKRERTLKDSIRKGIEDYFRANRVPKGMIEVSYEQELRLAYDIPADISDADRTLVISAIKALFETSVSLLGEENEQGYPVRYIGPHRMVLIPAGIFVMGAKIVNLIKDFDFTPRLVRITKDHWIAETATIEGLCRLFGLEGGNRKAPPDHPATKCSWNDSMAYMAAINKLFGTELCLPDEALSECSIRGGYVNIKEQMQEEGVPITFENFIKLVEGRYENFVPAVEMEATIYKDPRDPRIAKILGDEGASLFGWRQFGTSSGRLTHDEAWYDQEGANAAVWGPPNGYGLKGTCGGVWEWIADLYEDPYYEQEWFAVIGGGASWRANSIQMLRADYRHNFVCRLDDRDGLRGFRVVAPV